MSEAKKRRTSVKVTDELAERLADDAEAGYAARNIQCVQPAGAARVWRRARGHLPPSTPDWMTSSQICSSSAPNVTVSTSPTSFVKRCGPTSSERCAPSPSSRNLRRPVAFSRRVRPHMAVIIWSPIGVWLTWLLPGEGLEIDGAVPCRSCSDSIGGRFITRSPAGLCLVCVRVARRQARTPSAPIPSRGRWGGHRERPSLGRRTVAALLGELSGASGARWVGRRQPQARTDPAVARPSATCS